jgi:DNA-binding NarL/FixJ family response regulator
VRFAGEGFLTDMRAEAIEALAEANAIYRESGDAEKLSEALRLRSRLLGCAGLTAQSHADALEAVTVLEGRPDGPQLARAYALMAGCAMSTDDLGDAIAWGDRAIALAERVGDTEALVLALNYVGTSQLTRGLEDGRHNLDRSLDIALTAGRMTDVGLAYINVCAALGRRRRWKAVDDYLGPGIEYCREHGLEAWVACLVALEAESHAAQARWTEATEAAALILERAPDGVITDRYSALVSLAAVRTRRGDPGCWALLDEAVALARSFDELQFIGPVAVARAEAAWLEGRSDAVAQETEAALALAVERGDAWLAAELACWRRRAGIVEEPPAGEGPFALLVAGEHRAAAQGLRELSCPYDAALALADADDEDALRQALGELQALGAAPAAAIVARRLRERGARGLPRGPRRRTRENPAGLTSRELEVVALLTQGLSNAEIAQRLVLSEKTVGHHVSAILRKLDVPSRARAAAKASRLGLVES